MNKKIIIIHGWDGNPEEPLHQYLKSSLEKEGYLTVIPSMPNPSIPKIDEWIATIKDVAPAPEKTIFVGHSIGCQAILRYIEKINPIEKIPGIVLIAPWMKLDNTTLQEEGEEIKDIARPWMETPINFTNVKEKIKKVVAIFSDNDPYVNLSEIDFFKKELNAEIILEHNQGHFTISDNFSSLPSALSAVMKISKE